MSDVEELSYTLMNLGGGLNEGIPAEHIQDFEFAELENLYPFGSKLKRRAGTKRLTSTAYSERHTSLFPYKLSVGTWLLLVGSLTGVGKLDGTAVVPLTVSDGQTYASVEDPWHFRQFKDEILAARKSTGTLKRVTQDTIQDAGIAAPSTAPTLADGGAGVVEAGTFYGVVTFYNQTTNAESNPSPVSVALVLGANKRRAWSAIPTSLNGQVNARRLYVTLPNQQGEYYFVAQLNDNTTTTFDDNIIQANLGRTVSFNNGVPPSGVELVEVWRERSWVSDGKDVFFSNVHAGISNPQGFGEFDVIPVYEDDGHKITVLYAFGTVNIVGKTNAVHFITPAGGGFSLETLSDKHGCIAPLSMKSAERLLFWYQGKNVYLADGSDVRSISTVKIRKTLDRIPDNQKAKAVAAVDSQLGFYYLTVALDSSSTNKVVLAYNYKSDTWTTYPYPTDAPAFIGDFYDTNSAAILYGVFYDNHVYQLFTGTKDFDNAIVCKWKGKALGLDKPGVLKASRRLSLLAPQLAENVTLKLFRNGATAPSKTRVVSLDHASEWKRYSLSQPGSPAAAYQLGGEYSGTADFELGGMISEAIVLQRRGKVL
jgi:hypothetical protein